jgi:hypothetical protein
MATCHPDIPLKPILPATNQVHHPRPDLPPIRFILRSTSTGCSSRDESVLSTHSNTAQPILRHQPQLQLPQPRALRRIPSLTRGTALLPSAVPVPILRRQKQVSQRDTRRVHRIIPVQRRARLDECGRWRSGGHGWRRVAEWAPGFEGAGGGVSRALNGDGA